MPTIKKTLSRLFDPIDIALLVFFRIAFGALMLWEVWRYFEYDRIARYYVEPTYFFYYWGFDWLNPLPGDGMFWLFHGLGLLAILIMLGAFYRPAMVLFWLAFTYVFLLDKAQYLNHFYLVSLVSFLLIFIPAHRAFSVDAWLRPGIRSQQVPQWSLWLLRGQMAVVYFFGGVAKLNPDWFAGQPLREWMGARTDFPIIGSLFTEEWMVYLFTYSGLLLDLFVVPFLLWRRTRPFALLLAITFHLLNSQLFNIGIFPWFAIAATLIFLPPSTFRPRWLPLPTASLPALSGSRQRWILAAMALYFAVQIVLPLRHFLYPGDASWTEEGHVYAWRMRLREKDGEITFYASNPQTGTSWPLDVAQILNPRQLDQMKDNPPMILQFAHYLAEPLQAVEPTIRIHAHVPMSLNSRTPQLMIDPSADLSREPDSLFMADWIVPLTQKPYPHPPVPTILLSRRIESGLILMNIAEAAYPLHDVVIRVGAQALTAQDFGVTTLEPGECVKAFLPGTDLGRIFVPCNEVGQLASLASSSQQDTVVFESGPISQPCQAASCVFTRHD